MEQKMSLHLQPTMFKRYMDVYDLNPAGYAIVCNLELNRTIF